MTIDTAMRTSVVGMNRQQNTLSKVAQNVAEITSNIKKTSGGNSGNSNSDSDLLYNVTDMVVAKHSFVANFRIFQMSDELMAQIVNLKPDK